MESNQKDFITMKINKPKKPQELNKTDLIRYTLLSSAMHFSFWAQIIEGNSKEVGAEYLIDAPFCKGGFLVFADAECEPNEQGAFEHKKLDRKALVEGWKVMKSEYSRHYKDAINGHDDAITGDVYLQCCLFGEVIFG